MMMRKMWAGWSIGMVAWLLLLLAVSVRADVKVANISVKPRYPWNGLVDITYSIFCGETEHGEPVDIFIDFKGYDTVLETEFPMFSLTGDGAKAPLKTGGPYTVTWNAAKDYPTLNTSAFSIRIHATNGLYMVVDLSGGPKATHYPVRYSKKGPNLDDDTCRTTELWLRRIPAGKFIMGSPSDEAGRRDDWVNYREMACHEVTITRAFFIGVFECTQRQWELVMGAGTNPSQHQSADGCRPADQTCHDMIRGSSETAGGGWPQYGHVVDESSFMGKLQARTGLIFDLPTEAQWEYACRAGTTTALNSGKDWSIDAIKEVARCNYNRSDGKGGYSQHTKVGCYLPNAWGLYDMHGNLWEWCLDRWGIDTTSTLPVEDPAGPDTGGSGVVRGGSWESGPEITCLRSASRIKAGFAEVGDDGGFRIVCNLFNQ